MDFFDTLNQALQARGVRRLAVPVLAIVMLCLASAGCSRSSTAQLAPVSPSPNATPEPQPLSKFIVGVWNAFLHDRFRESPAEEYRDVYVLAEGIDPRELPSNVGQTKFQYIKRDQIVPMAKLQVTETQGFGYFRLSAGPPTSEGWRTISLVDCAAWKEPDGLSFTHGSGAGAYSYAEVRIEGRFYTVCYMSWIQ